jgi:uncharacterized metal-binding protein
MKAYIEKYGVKHSIETDCDDEDVFEFTRNIYNLMLTAGYSKNNIIEGLQYIVNENLEQ